MAKCFLAPLAFLQITFFNTNRAAWLTKCASLKPISGHLAIRPRIKERSAALVDAHACAVRNGLGCKSNTPRPGPRSICRSGQASWTPYVERDRINLRKGIPGTRGTADPWRHRHVVHATCRARGVLPGRPCQVRPVSDQVALLFAPQTFQPCTR